MRRPDPERDGLMTKVLEVQRYIGDQQMYIGPNAGTWFSDDDAVLVDADLYREFVVPYNSRILTAFGGGIVHFCGNGTHHAENFLATDGLVGLNTFTLHDLDATARLQSQMQGKVVLIVGDHTPLDYRTYFDALRSRLDPRGVAILSLYSPILGLLPDGRYGQTDRAVDGAKDVYRELLGAFDVTDAPH